MQRLLVDAQKLTGVKYDINNLSDVYQAVHAIQGQIGITGTTAKEADTTLTGSFNSMKSAFTDLLGNITSGNGDIKANLGAFISTLNTFLGENLLPMFGNLLSAIPELLNTFFTEILPQLLPKLAELFTSISGWFAEHAPDIVSKGFDLVINLVTGIGNALPQLIATVPKLIGDFIVGIVKMSPEIIAKGIELITSLATGLIKGIPELIKTGPQLIAAIWDKLKNFDWIGSGAKILKALLNGILSVLGALKNAGIEILSAVWNNIKSMPDKLWNLGKSALSKLGEAIGSMLGFIGGKIGSIASSIVNKIRELPSKMLSIGSNIVRGLWNGIANVAGWIKSKISGFVDGIIGGIKSFFGINSPSRVMASEVGKFIPAGLAVGIEDNLGAVSNAIDEMGSIATKDFQSTIGFSSSVVSGDNAFEDSQKNVTLKATLAMGTNEYKLFVNDVTRTQDEQLDFAYAY